MHEGQILFGQTGDGQLQQVHLLRPRQGQKDVQRAFITLQIDDEGLLRLDLFDGGEVEIRLEGLAHAPSPAI